MAWDLKTPEQIDRMVEFALANNITQIFAHTRYRGDALYTPNRIFDTYANPEPRSYILNNDHFDPLAYLIDVAARSDIEVHAWVTVFVVTPKTVENLPPQHIYYTRKEWITEDFRGYQMSYDSYEGAYLDPGIPEVHDYLIDIFLDIVNNYQVAGMQLDYIRYPDSQYGYNPLAIEHYRQSGYDASDFHRWKSDQISRFVRRFYAEIKYQNPGLLVSAAVISNLERAQRKYYQDWTDWLDEGIIDYAYLMSYSISDDIVHTELRGVKQWRDRIVVGLRAWTEDQRPYSPDLVSSKISLSNRLGFPGIALFSYSGVKLNHNHQLRKTLAGKASGAVPRSDNFIFGYVTDHNNRPLQGVPVQLNGSSHRVLTDPNGFFLFNNLKSGNYTLKCEQGIRVLFSSTINILDNPGVQAYKYDLHFSKEDVID